MYVAVTVASKRSQIRAMKWIQKVETCIDIEELEITLRRWDELDNSLAEAIVTNANGETGL